MRDFLLVTILIAAAMAGGPAHAGDSPNGDTSAAWPTTFTAYGKTDGTKIMDANNDENPLNVDIWSGSTSLTQPSCYIAVSSTHAFFRMRLQNDPSKDGQGNTAKPTSGGGFDEATWLVFVAVNGTTQGVMGISGKNSNGDDYVYVKKAGQTEVKVFDSPFTGTSAGARAVQDGTEGFFVDWQCPLSRIYTTLGISPSTALQFFFGTSISNSLDVINKDYMLGSSVSYSGLQSISLRRAFLSATKTATLLTGTNPPASNNTSTYDVTITVTNTGGNTATSVSAVDVVGSGAVVLGKRTSNGSVSGTGQTVNWSPPDISATATVTATITVSVTPSNSDVGNTITINSNCSITASDASSGDTTSANCPVLTIGPVVMGAVATQRVSGTVYLDANHNALRDSGENGTGLTLFAKLINETSPSAATAAAAVSASTGDYTLTSVSAGSYSVLIDDNNTLSDVSPTISTAYVGTDAPGFKRTGLVVFSYAGVGDVDFGLFHGASASGTVFKDTGSGSGTANNGIQDGTENGLAGVPVKARNGSGTELDGTFTAGDGSYKLHVPHGSTTVKIVETNPNAFTSIGGDAGNSGGSYDRDTDTFTYTFASGTSPSGIDFGDVPNNTLVPDGLQTGLPGGMVFYPHIFTPGTAGQVAFSAVHTSIPALEGWTGALYKDDDCDGTIDSTDVVITGPISLIAGDKLCLVAAVFIPQDAPLEAQDQLALSASFGYSGETPALTAQNARTDVTRVGSSAASGLLLVKTASVASAKPGDPITFVVTYTNRSSESLSNVVIHDFTPPYTTYVSGSCGTTPAGITGCSLATQPSAGATGALRWTLAGTLKPGSSGTVSYIVEVD